MLRASGIPHQSTTDRSNIRAQLPLRSASLYKTPAIPRKLYCNPNDSTIPRIYDCTTAGHFVSERDISNIHFTSTSDTALLTQHKRQNDVRISFSQPRHLSTSPLHGRSYSAAMHACRDRFPHVGVLGASADCKCRQRTGGYSASRSDGQDGGDGMGGRTGYAIGPIEEHRRRLFVCKVLPFEMLRCPIERGDWGCDDFPTLASL